VLGAVLAFMTTVLTLRQVAPKTGEWGEGDGEESALAGLIKGTTTVNDIVEATDITPGEITAEFGRPASDFDRKLSQIKGRYGFEPEDVRTCVEQRLGL
jgi:hypothetical protein